MPNIFQTMDSVQHNIHDRVNLSPVRAYSAAFVGRIINCASVLVASSYDSAVPLIAPP
jgi:hypothetical protein